MSISRLCLGTAKLGMPWYGAGSVSRPGSAEIEAILRCAFAGGIRWFDTAAAYGDAEDWLTHVLPAEDCRFVTKVSPALARLGALADKLDGWQHVLLHNLTLEDVTSAWAATVGLSISYAQRVGVSVYDPAETDQYVARGWRIVQVPYCLLDRRHELAMREARQRGVVIFARQPFLQGLLTNGMISAAAAAMRRDGRLLASAIGFWYAMGECCERHGLSRVERACGLRWTHRPTTSSSVSDPSRTWRRSWRSPAGNRPRRGRPAATSCSGSRRWCRR